jgi:hypothetical protein
MMQITQRGRVARWTREKLDTLSTIELRQLYVNAQRLQETEIATMCNDILTARPRGVAPVRKARKKSTVLKPITSSGGRSR